MPRSTRLPRSSLHNAVRGCVVRVLLLAAVISSFVSAKAGPKVSTENLSADIVVVGAGISGLSAALEAGRSGASVVVIDMSSVFGGHAVMAQGLLSIVGTPLQAKAGIEDSPALAIEDFKNWGEDPNPEWVRYYAEHSREEVFDWLSGLGVVFERLGQPPGNSVPRAHTIRGRGVGLVAPIYRECLQTPTIHFRWNTRLDRLLRSHDRVTGLVATDLRSGKTLTINARFIVLATGGFQSNLSLVREVWPKDLPLPGRVLAGGGANAKGSALPIAQETGAVIERLDHQWNYITGTPDPRFPGSNRGLVVSMPSVWVNTKGRRFIAEGPPAKNAMETLLRQPGGTYWAIFSSDALHSFYVSGSDWSDYSKIERLIINNPAIVLRGETLEELCAKTGLPLPALSKTLARFNHLAVQGVDEDFHRQGALPEISGPPYFAVQYFPLTRKSLGGVAVDLDCRALDKDRNPIPGLYAVGEVAGFGGLNGKAGLEGTFLAPGLVMGRVAARHILEDLGKTPAPPPTGRAPFVFQPLDQKSSNKNPPADCMRCHALPNLVAQKRPGFWHFEKAHQVVLEKQLSCATCHAEVSTDPARAPELHRIKPVQQLQSCSLCHQGESR